MSPLESAAVIYCSRGRFHNFSVRFYELAALRFVLLLQVEETNLSLSSFVEIAGDEGRCFYVVRITMIDAKSFVVDCDSHVLEPPDLWLRYLEPKYRDRAIVIEQGPNGFEQFVVDKEVLLEGRLAALGGVEHNATKLFKEKSATYMSGAPAASMETDARVKLLDDWGVDAGVVFPTLGIMWDKDDDPQLAMAYARAYNRWQWDFASPALNRILPIAHIPLYDVELALEELRRCIKLGFKGMFLAPERIGGKRPSNEAFDPLWAELQDANLPLCMHLIVRLNRNVSGAISDWTEFTSGKTLKGNANTVFSFSIGGTTQLIPAVAAIVSDGIFDRFPRLKVAVVEAGAGFAGYLMDRMDSKYDRFGCETMKCKPSEYFRKNLWFVMDPGERGINGQCELIGETQLLWGSDFPHIDSHITAAEEVRASLMGLSEHRRRLILGENAARLFNLNRP